MTAFPADAESNLFEGPYPEFFQALAHFAYPGDVRRIREARSEWRAHNPCEYPPLFDECGWDAPRTGEAFKALWLKLEEGAVHSWLRMGKDGPYEAINPSDWRRGRENAMRQIRPPQPRPRADLLVVSTGPPLVGDLFDRRIPEFDFFIVLLVNETFLRDVVVSRDDIPKRAPAALAAGAPPDVSAKPDSAIPFNEIVSLYRSLMGLAENREQADIIVEFLVWPIPRKTLNSSAPGVRFRREERPAQKTRTIKPGQTRTSPGLRPGFFSGPNASRSQESAREPYIMSTSENPAVADIDAREAADPSVLKSRKQCQTEGGWGQTTQIAKEDSSALHRVNVGMSVKITSKSFYQHLRDLASAQPRKLRQPSARYQKRPRERTAAELRGLQIGNAQRAEQARKRREAKAGARAT